MDLKLRPCPQYDGKIDNTKLEVSGASSKRLIFVVWTVHNERGLPQYAK